MDNLPVLVLVDSNVVVKNRIRKILSDQEITIYEAYNRWGLLKIMAENKYQVDLIITDVQIDTDSSLDGISLMKLVKSKSDTIPVVVLTSTSSSEVILKYLSEGVAEYILKPFEDSYLKEKILKYINSESLTEFTVIKFSLKNFLESEFYKAKKGGYPITLLKISFQLNTSDPTKQLNNEFYKYSKSVYEEIKSTLWDSDIYIQHGYHSHLGFFPFCDQENSKIISSKIIAKFEAFKLTDPKMQDYTLIQTFVTYPTDGDSVNQLLMALESRTEEIIDCQG
ncbi:MAG: response regulator [Eubacteriaceae bacterium]|nr:response regulator [Eubacteriaceae bacterium]